MQKPGFDKISKGYCYTIILYAINAPNFKYSI